MLVRLLPVFVLVLCAARAFGDSADPTRWTVDDVLLASSDADFQLAPDARSVVWVRTEVDPEKGRIHHLMRANLETGRKVQLTRGKHQVTQPRWSPDGKHVAFLSDRPDPDAKPEKASRSRRGSRGDEKEEPVVQLWLLDAEGGEPRALTRGKQPVQSFNWAGNDDLILVAREDPTERELRFKEEKDTSNVVEDDRHNPPVRLFRIALDKDRLTRLGDNADTIDQLAVSPDGKFALAVHSRSLRFTYDNRTKPVTRLHDLTKGTSEVVLAPEIVPNAFIWALDGSGCYVVYDKSSQPEFNQAGVTHAAWFDPTTRQAKSIDLDWANGLTIQSGNGNKAGLVAVRDGFLALLANGVRPKLARYTRQGQTWKREAVAGESVGNIFGIEPDAAGTRLIYAHSTASIPTQWYQAPLAGTQLKKGQPVTEVAETLVKKKKARTEVVRWKGALDEEVEGILYYPHEYREGQRHPLIVAIHGGPAGTDYDAWEETWAYAANLYCQRGAFVLKPNYHGSTDYGQKWLESITRGKYCDLEPIDINRGVDHLIARGLVDKDKLGILGWSNGGILTALITTQTDRYKAAAPGAGTIEYISDWANCEFGDAFDRFYLGKSALEDPKFYQSKSPFFAMNKVKTPTIIFFGTEDRVVPTQQGWMHYRALQQIGKTDVKFLLFPGEAHSLKLLAHQRRKLTEELAWFDRHLFGTFKETNTALKQESPLAALVARTKSASVAGKFGLLHQDVLIPEVVPYQGITLGRYEVTRAQFARFDPKALPAPGTENYPVAVTYEQARDYCKWLSEKTGATYRLPGTEEADTVYPDPKEGENVLDYWAGYAVNPDDAAKLLGELKALPGEPTLLRPVGSFKGLGEPMVFDLGGNAAEWVVGPDGKGVVRGGSADRPADPKAKGEPGAGYRGFRVVRER